MAQGPGNFHLPALTVAVVRAYEGVKKLRGADVIEANHTLAVLTLERVPPRAVTGMRTRVTSFSDPRAFQVLPGESLRYG